jgi:hypothetical protein
MNFGKRRTRRRSRRSRRTRRKSRRSRRTRRRSRRHFGKKKKSNKSNMSIKKAAMYTAALGGVLGSAVVGKAGLDYIRSNQSKSDQSPKTFSILDNPVAIVGKKVD